MTTTVERPLTALRVVEPAVRRLAHRVHDVQPGPAAPAVQHVEWAIEHALDRASDEQNDREYDAIRTVRPDLTAAQVGTQIELLLDLADAVAAEDVRTHGHTSAWFGAVEDYGWALYVFAAGGKS